MNAITDTGLLLATSICLYSTGHWIGGTIALILALIPLLK